MSHKENVGFTKSAKHEHDYCTGAHRDNREGKGSLVEMPWNALFLVSRIYEIGNRGRGWRNWEFGMPVQDLVDSGMRHAARYVAGHRTEPHLSQAIWNLLNALEMAIRVERGELDPKIFNKFPNHYGKWNPDMPSPPPLSPQEREWLKAIGIILPEVENGRSNGKQAVGNLPRVRKATNSRSKRRR